MVELGYLLRYFAHGIVWSILIFLLAFAWTFILVALVAALYRIVYAGLLLGLFLGFALLFLLMGVVNSTITYFIWDIDIKLGLIGNLIHGMVLFIALIIAHIPIDLISLFMPGLNTAIVLFVPYCFIDGFVAKKVATIWPH